MESPKRKNDEIVKSAENVRNMIYHRLRPPSTLFRWEIFIIQKKIFFDFLGLGGGSKVGRGWSFGGVNGGN